MQITKVYKKINTPLQKTSATRRFAKMKLDRKEAGQQQPEQSRECTFRPMVTTMYNTSVQIWYCKAWRERKRENNTRERRWYTKSSLVSMSWGKMHWRKSKQEKTMLHETIKKEQDGNSHKYELNHQNLVMVANYECNFENSAIWHLKIWNGTRDLLDIKLTLFFSTRWRRWWWV